MERYRQRALIVRSAPLLAIALATLMSCATDVSRLHPYHVPPESLRMTQVMHLASRAEIVGMGSHYELLLASGVPDSSLVDGSVGVGRVYCCGGPEWQGEHGQAIWFLVPHGFKVEVGDFVEVKMGKVPDGNDHGFVNTVENIRQKREDRNQQCRWEPDDPTLWARIIYCDWMPQEGWVKQTGIIETWYKPRQ